MRPPADPYVPGPRVRTEGVGQERPEGHAPHGTQMPDPRRESMERLQLVQGRRWRRVPNLLKRDFTAGKPFEKLGTDVTEFKVAGGRLPRARVRHGQQGNRRLGREPAPRHGAAAASARHAEARLPGARTRSCTRTWDGSTSTRGGAGSSNGWASASP